MIPLIHADRIVERYWAAIPVTERQRIADAIPPGCVLRIVAGHPGQPGTATVRLIRLDEGELVAQERGRLGVDLVGRVLAQAPA